MPGLIPGASLTGQVLSRPRSAVSSAKKISGAVAGSRPSPTCLPSMYRRTLPVPLAEASTLVVELHPDLVPESLGARPLEGWLALAEACYDRMITKGAVASRRSHCRS
jgi:hypothetical protein